MARVAILTTVHSPFDARIFYKQAKTLAAAGYETVLIAQYPQRHAVKEGIQVRGLPRLRRHWLRPINWLVSAWYGIHENADVYHLHDPELLLCGLAIHWLTGKPVIYDAHEYYPDKMLKRQWLPKRLRSLVRGIMLRVEPLLASGLSATVTADELTAQHLRARGVQRVTTIYNFPLPDLWPRPSAESRSRDQRGPGLLFVGTVGPDRGAFLMLDAVERLVTQHRCQAKLYIVGPVRSAWLKEKLTERVKELGLDANVVLVGEVPHSELCRFAEMADMGFLAYDPDICRYNIPTKMFEYMAAGLPIIATEAPMISHFLAPVDAGIIISSQDPSEYASAIAALWKTPETMRRMAANGRRAFEEKYNWTAEGERLVELYRSICADGPSNSK